MINIDFKNIPDVSGVYIFKDFLGNAIYIGKAVSIKDRVKSYFSKSNQDWKVDYLLKEAATLEFIPLKTEEEALVLEAELVKKYKPKFNVLLKEGDPFLYFLITAEDFPKFEIVRTQQKKGKYFGPFINKAKTRKIFEYLMREFKLKVCNKKSESGCLEYHLGLCAGSCRSDFNLDDYKLRLKLVEKLLNKDLNGFEDFLKSAILDASKNLEYEKAMHLKHYLDNLPAIVKYLEINFSLDKYSSDIAYKMSSISQTISNPKDIGAKLKEFLNMDFEPETIDCFDISHFQGNWIVGSCVRFKNGLPDKNKFRKFKIKTLVDQNDYAALQEIVSRRYKDPAEIPDIVLIDGGKGQLSAVKKVLPNAFCVSIAKREETLYGTGFMDGKKLSLNSDVGRLLISIRDYAHHFAISYHRQRRSH